MDPHLSRILAAIADYHQRGWTLIPVHGIENGACTCSRGATCPAAGKHPVLPSWSKKLLTLDEIVGFFSTADRPYNIGIVTGPVSKLFVVDIDTRSGGLDSLQQLAAAGNDLPCTVLFHTGSGGYHILYQLPDGATVRSSAGSLAPGIDIRGAGGMIVAPPSLHKSGAYYRQDSTITPESMPDVPPAWLLQRLKATAARPALVIEPGRKLHEGQRHPPFLRIAGLLHRYGATEENVFRTLRTLDEEMCDPPLGDEETHRIAQSSGKWEPQHEADFIDPKDYLGLASAFLEARHTHLDGRTLHYWRGEWYLWDGTVYRQHDAAEIRADAVLLHSRMMIRKKVGQELIEVPFQPDIKHGNEILRALETQTMLPADTKWPSWRGTQEKEIPANQILACTNGLLNLQTRELLRHTPAYLVRHSIGLAFDAGAAAPTEWLAFLAEIWEGDQASIDTLQEIFGYIVAGGLEQQAMFLILGPPRSGKGTIGAILEALVGRQNSVSPTLSCLASAFGLEPLIDKRLALISDCRLGKRADQSAIVEKLLPYSAGDTQLANRKHKQMQAFTPTARFLFLTNELPGFFDASGALASRFVPLKLTRSFIGKEDRSLQQRLLGELPGILLWALDGYDRLQARGRFVQPESSEDIVDELRELTSQVGAFVEQQCLVGPDHQVPRRDLFEAYLRWLASEQGWHTSVTFSRFSSELRAAVPGLRRARPRSDAAGPRPRVWIGVALRPPERGPHKGMLPA